jgi:hypothetical protein
MAGILGALLQRRGHARLVEAAVEVPAAPCCLFDSILQLLLYIISIVHAAAAWHCSSRQFCMSHLLLLTLAAVPAALPPLANSLAEAKMAIAKVLLVWCCAAVLLAGEAKIPAVPYCLVVLPNSDCCLHVHPAELSSAQTHA